MKILIVGETWSTFNIHIKGFDPFFNAVHENGATFLLKALTEHGCEVNQITNQEASAAFPVEMDQLTEYDVIFLSDIGANTLLLHPATFARSERTPNRLKLLKNYVENGGGLGMIGGYLTFQGIDAKGQWSGTPVEEVLPVRIQKFDDRREVPEGFSPVPSSESHPVLQGISPDWPWFLGYNVLEAKPGAQVLLKHEQDPFLVLGSFGKGRSGAFASDCAPHWGSKAFVEWEHYGSFWYQLARWLSGDIG